MAGQRYCTTIEQVHDGRVAQQSCVRRKKSRVVGEQGCDRWRNHWHRGAEHRVVVSHRFMHRRDPRGAACDQVDVFGCAHSFAAADAQRHAWVVARLLADQQFAVPGPGFNRRKATARHDARDLAQCRNVDFFDVCPGPAECSQAACEGLGHRRVQFAKHEAARRGEPQGTRCDRAQYRGSIRQDAVQQRRVAHRARDRAHRVERRRQRNAARCGRQAGRVLEPDQPLKCGGNPNRAPGVGAERGPRRAGCDRHRAAGR